MPFHKINNRPTCESGQVLVLFALASFVLVGFMALAMDVGYLLTERREAQNAADAAALAGATELFRGESDDTIRGTAQNYAALNGVTNGGGASVEVTITGDQRNGRVEVEIINPVQRFFLGAVYTGPWEVGSRAVAEVADNVNGRYALVALEEPGMYVNGNMGIDIIDGSAASNGDVSRSGDANAFTTDNTIDAVGTVNEGSLWEAPGGFNDTRPTIVDPLAGASPPPGVPPLTVQAEPDCWGNDCVLEPGYYANMTIRINQTAILNPGLYYFHNTTVRVQDPYARIEGHGVMLYLDGSSLFEPRTAEVYLTAPETSPYAGGVDGMVLWIANCSEFNSQGNNEFYLKGIFYAPCSDVWLHGNPLGVAVEGQVIVGTLDIRGTSDFVAQYDDLVFIPRLEIYLVE